MNDIADPGIRFGRIAAMLPVKDIEKAQDFYSKVFGFTETFENGNPVGFMILERCRGTSSHPTANLQGGALQRRAYDGE